LRDEVLSSFVKEERGRDLDEVLSSLLWWASRLHKHCPVGRHSENEVDGEGDSAEAEEDVRGAIAEAAHGEDEEEEEEGEEEGGEDQPGVQK